MKEKWSKFNTAVACMCYSVASADSVISKSEVKTLKALVRNHWLDVEHSVDEYGTDKAFQIESVFDWLNDEGISSEKALKKFESFHKENPGFITPELKKLILSSAQAIAKAFGGIHEEEKAIIKKIKALLQ